MNPDGRGLSDTPRSVLVVDDDLALVRLIAHWLRSVGYVVMQATDGAEALELVRASPPDILITDWEMPGLDGIELCRAVRQLSLPHYVYIVVLTGKSEEDLLIACLDAGADNFLHKPVSQGELLARVRTSARLLDLELQLREAALRDALTGLPGRRAFMEQFYRQWHRSRRERQPLACAMADIDFFKRINDCYGHAAGDEVLRSVARVLRHYVRASDVLGRLGGEEFCVVLPNCDEEGAEEWAERARLAIARTPAVMGDTTLFVTASFGVAALEEDVNSPEELLDRADQALLCAKQAGRDRVVRYSAAIEESIFPLEETRGTHDPFAGITAADVMTPVVVTFSETDSVASAIEVFTRLRTNSAPVVRSDGALVGIVSEKDLMHALGSLSAWFKPLGELMRHNVVTFDVTTPVRRIYEFLCRVTIRRVVIVEKNKPVGTISRGTLLRWFRNLALAKGLLPLYSAEAADRAQQSLFVRVEAVIGHVAEKLVYLGHKLKELLSRPQAEVVPTVVGAATALQSLTNDLLSCSQSLSDEVAQDPEEAFGTVVGFPAD